MKKYYILFLFINIAVFAQNPYWNWAKMNQTEYGETIVDTQFDSKGNFLVLGQFQLNLTIDQTTINCTNGRAGYIAKYNKNGDLLWLKDINPLGKDLSLYSIHVDKNNNVIISGSVNINSYPFNQTEYTPLTFDNNNHNLTIPLAGTLFNKIAFLAKFNSNGQFEWVKDNNGLSEISAITSDQNNNLYVTGSFTTNTLIIQNLQIAKNLMYQGIPDGYIAKYDSNGNVLKLKGLSGDSFDMPKQIKFNNNGNISIAGYFNSPNLIYENETLVNSNNNDDVFHLEIDTNLNYISKYSIDNFESYSINPGSSFLYLNPNNEIIIYGHFNSDNYNYLDLNLLKIGLSDMYITKYNNGNRLWVKQISYSNSYLFLDKISEDSSNNIYIASDFTSPTITFNHTTLYNNCESSTMIMKLDNSQNIKWIIGANGNTEDNFPISIQCHENNILVGGFLTSDAITFDNTTLVYNDNWSRSYLAMIKENNILQDQISIYPNPVNTEINVICNTRLKDKPYQIINPLGKIISESKIKNNSNTINVDELQKGIYFIKIEGFDSVKFIKN